MISDNNNTTTTTTTTTTIHSTTPTPTTTTTPTTTNPMSMNHQIRDDEWKEFEKSLGSGTDIAKCLAEYVSHLVKGESIEQSVQASYPTTFPEGFDNYRKIQSDRKKKIIGFSELYAVNPDLTISYTSDIPNKKIEQMKLKNSIASYNSDINKLLETETSLIPSPVGSNCIDIKILELIKFMKTMIRTPIHKVDMEKAYETFFGIGKILENIRNILVRHHTTGKITNIHVMIINPLEQKYHDFVTHFHFDYSIASTRYPRLFYSTKFDKIFPGMSVKPYESQKQMLDFVNENFSNPFVCVFNSLMASGKTWVAGYIGLLVHLTNIKTNSYRNNPKTFIYTCPEILKSVRHIVGRILHYHDVPFALAFIEKGKVLIKKQNSCKGDGKKPTVILAGVQATIELMKEDYFDIKEHYTIDKDNTIVFFDENTIQMDKNPSPMVPYLTEFYRNLPPQVIFSSATHPKIENMERLREYALSKYPEIIFKTIDYSKVLIGTQLNKLDGEMFIPHSYCNDTLSMDNFISFIKNNIMYKKFYTIPLVRAMYDKIVELGLELPVHLNFDNWMDELCHRNQEYIQNLGIAYLRFIRDLSSTDPTIVSRFNEIIKTNQGINFENLVESSRVLSGQTFISCVNPELLMENKFGAYFRSVMEKLRIRDFEDLNDRYKKLILLKEKREKSAAKMKSARSDDKFSRDQRARDEAESLESMEIPDIPDEFKLGNVRTSISIGSVNWDNIIASDMVKFAALFGVFIYSEESHHTYNNFVIDLISRGIGVYVFADATLNYGNSFPFNNGIITNDMASHSDKTLLQLMARAGRPGISHTAIIYAGDLILTKINETINNTINNQEYIDLEFANLNQCIDLSYRLDAEELVRQQEEQEQAVMREEQARLRAVREEERQVRLRVEQERQAKLRAEQEAEQARLIAEQETEQARLISEQNAQLNSRWGRDREYESKESRETGSGYIRGFRSNTQRTQNSSSALNWTRSQKL